MRLEDGFKETEIGPIPVEWEVVRLGEIAEKRKFAIVDGPFGSQMKVSEFKDSGVPVIEMEHLKGNRFTGEIRRFISEQKYEEVKRSTVVAGDLVISKTGTLGLVAIVPQWITRAVMTSRLAKVSIDSKLAETNFVFFALLHLQQSGYWEQVGEGTTMKVLSLKKIAEAPISLPSLPEQRRIARVLSTIQRAIAAQDALIAAARELKRSLMRHLFTYGPVPLDQADQVPLKETEIGAVPEDWEVGRLGKALQTTQYGLSVRADRTGTYPMLRMNNLVDGWVDTSDLKYVDLDKSDFAKFSVQKRDVLFNRTNSYELVGKTAIFDLEGDFVFASYLIRVVPDVTQLLPEYLNYYLNWDDAQRWLKMLATRGVSQSNISATKLGQFVIRLPSPVEQEQIVQLLSAVDRKIEVEERRKAALQALFKTMLHQLMTGQVRV